MSIHIVYGRFLNSPTSSHCVISSPQLHKAAFLGPKDAFATILYYTSSFWVFDSSLLTCVRLTSLQYVVFDPNIYWGGNEFCQLPRL